jgi:uncharacterized protein (DUF1015 family)
MPEVRPFRGVRFAGRRRDLGPLIAPPYDVIAGEAEVSALRARHPHNVVRLILPADRPDEPGSRYRAAREELHEWLRDGVLAQDSQPAFYPYRQTYHLNGGPPMERAGFLGLLRLEPFGPRVMAHENTLAGPREDRLRLLQQVGANMSPVFALFEDPDSTVRDALARAMGAPGEASARRGAREHDELWQLLDPAAIDSIATVLRDQPLVIADGHHRYESALHHLRDLRERGEDPGSAAYCMVFFAPVPQPGLSILPTHRVVHGLPAQRVAGLERRLSECFDMEPAGDWEQPRDVAAWESAAATRPGGVLGFAAPHDGTLYTLTPRARAVAPLLEELAPALRELDVSVLHEVVLRHVLGVGPEELRRGDCVWYPHDARAALRELRSGGQAAFLLRPTPIDAVFRVARAGLRMPQKSTFFYPKVSTGFVLHRHE